ncbi:MAG: zinc ribbon domain-containing protein [Deltaproteobacteria bacterium]|nr:zinc ribbon domain-containing protein [Deltaproteobacteria bacterium]
MPIYEYHCGACQKDHEIIQKVNDAPLAICPACGGALQKKLSAGSFSLKGGGWYKDGYSSKQEKPPEKTKESAPKKETAAEGTAKKSEK